MGSTYHQLVALYCIQCSSGCDVNPAAKSVVANLPFAPFGKNKPGIDAFPVPYSTCNICSPNSSQQNAFSLKDETTEESKIPYLVVHTYMPSNYLEH